MERLRWGILGTGTIAGLFAEGLAVSETGTLHAIASRDPARARAFAERFGAKLAFGEYAALVASPEVDVVYIATPNSRHAEDTLLALRAGKPVLCEKPFTVDRAETALVVAEARSRGLFLMEAMWTRFFPLTTELRRTIATGAIGELRSVEADFGFRSDPASEPRLFDPAFGGGSLLDVGVYAVSLASWFFGTPDRIAAMADVGPTGADERATAILGYAGGRSAVCRSSLREDTPQEARLIGTEGWLRVESPFWRPSRMTVFREGEAPRVVDRPYSGNGYNVEADEVARRIRAGETESPVMPLDETAAIMGTMDWIRTSCAGGGPDARRAADGRGAGIGSSGASL